MAPALHVAPGEDAGDVVEHVVGRVLVVAVVADQAALDDVDLLLRVLVDHAGDQVLELDRVLLVLEELEFQGLLEPLVGLVVELLAVEREGADVVHDLAAEVVLAALGDVDLLLDRPHQPLVGLLGLAGVLVLDLLALGVRLDVVDVVAAEAGQGVLVGGDGPLDLVLHDVLVFFLDHGQQVLVVLLHLVAVDQRVVLQPGFQFVEDHERVDRPLVGVGDQGVGDLVLDVARADPVHPLALGLLAKLLDVVLGEPRQGLAVVELELLEQRQPGVLGLLQPGEDRPHRGDLQRVRRDLLAADLPAVVVLLIDVDLVGQPRDVRHVDLDRPVAEGFHELVGLELLVFGLVGVPDDDFVDVGLGELLRLDLVFLAGAEEVVEEGDVELQDLDELDQAAVGDVELAVEVERPRVALGAVLGDLPVVDVAGQLGGVLVLLVLGLERADADAVLLGEDQAADPDVVQDLAPVAVVLGHPLVVRLAAEGAEVPLDGDRVVVVGRLRGDRLDQIAAELRRDEVERLLVHRAVDERVGAVEPLLAPAVGVERPLVGPRVVLQPLLQQADDRALGAADRPVEQEHAALGPVAVGGALEDVDQVHQRPFEAEDGVLPAFDRVVEELVAGQLLLVDDDLVGAEAEDHVVEPLVGGPGDRGVAADDVQVFGEGAGPVLLLVIRQVLAAGDQGDQIRSCGHKRSPS